MIRRLQLRSIIIGAVTAIAVGGAASLVLLLGISVRRHSEFDAHVLRALEDATVAAVVRTEVERQLDIARAHAAAPNPLLARQFEIAGEHAHDQLRFYLFRPLSASERRLVERIHETHARLEVGAQRVFFGLPYEIDPSLTTSLTRDLESFVEARRTWRIHIEQLQAELNRGLFAAAAGVGLIFLAMILLLLRLLQRRLLDRIDGLAAAAARVGAGDFSARVPLAFADELTDLGAAFNRMVDDQEKATTRLQESEERYRSLFESVPMGLYRSTPDGRFLDVNRIGAQMLGYDDQAALLRAPVPLPLTEREAWKREMAESRGVHQVTWQLQKPDGGMVWIRDTAHAVRDAEGNVLHYEGALEDVTERVQTQWALERSEARFRSLIENGSEAILVIDVEGVVRYQSPGVHRMLGYVNGDAARERPLELVHPEDREAVALTLRDLISGLTPPEYLEFRCRHSTGEWRTLRVVASNMLHDPHVRGVVVNMVDVTEQRALEQRYLHSQKMEAVGRLAGGIAHDFNNLLTAIGGYAELLQQRGAGDELSSDLREIQHAVERAASLTRQLLAFSRQQVVQPRPLDLSVVVRNIRGMLERVIGEDVELVATLAPQVWVLADTGQIEQVLLNFVVNARDAMPDGGTLTISTAVVSLVEGEHGLRAGRYARLTVADTGHGMSADVLAQAFEPFFTTKEVGKGTGLGLATVYGIATQAGGSVVAESVPGAGSRLSVLLPLIEAPVDVAAPQAVARPAQHGRERVLLVEDETAVRVLVERVLRRQGHEVVSASNGREALELMERETRPFELVVTDVVMPEISGPQMVEELLRRDPTLRVLYISGYARESFTRNAVFAGPVNFLEKPFTPDQLARRVREVLDQGLVPA